MRRGVTGLSRGPLLDRYMQFSWKCMWVLCESMSQSKQLPFEEPCHARQVVAAGSAIGDMALHFIEKYGMMALRIPSKFDLRRFCRRGPAAASCLALASHFLTLLLRGALL